MAIAVAVTDAAEISTYGELIERITDHTDGRVAEANIPTYIRLAEAEMNRRLALRPLRPMQCRETITIDAQKQPLPSLYMSTDSLQVTDGTNSYTIDFVEPENFDDRNVARQNQDFTGFVQTTPDRPLNYTVIGSELYFYPTPTQSWSGSHTYYKRLTPLSNSSNTNWLLRDHPDVYYTGTLAFCYHYLPDLEASKLNMELFSALLGNISDAYPKATEKALLRSEVGGLTNYRNRYYQL